MKKAEWERRLPFDRKGLAIFGAALLERAKRLEKHTAEQLKFLKEAEDSPEPSNESIWRREAEDTQRELRRRRERVGNLMSLVDDLDVTEDELVAARKVRIKDFRYRWDMLFENSWVIGYTTDDVPKWAKSWDRETPICERWNEQEMDLLIGLFISECSRFFGPNPESTRFALTKDEMIFELLAWRLCEPEPGQGQPPGRRYIDGRVNAASYAYSIMLKHEAGGNRLTKAAAIRLALQKYTVIGSQDYDKYPDKDDIIVSDAAGPNGKMGGAEKIVRKELERILHNERDSNY